MKFEQTMNKVFTNTYVLYGLFAYSLLTILGYLFMQNFDAIVVFALVGIIAINFSRNMAVVLFICLSAVHILLPNFKLVKKVTEGLKSMGSKDDTTTDEPAIDETATTDETTTKDPSAMSDEDKKKMMMMKKMKDAKSGSSSSSSDSASSGSSKMTKPTMSDSSVESSSDNTSGFRPMGENEEKDKLNYGASIHSAYQDLNSILGGDAIKNLTSETMMLMKEQKKLTDSLSSMGPFMEQAQDLLAGFKNSGLGK